MSGTDGGHLADNIVHFARLLRRAGLPVGPDRALEAVRAVEVAGVARRADLYWTLNAVLTDRREHQPTFEEAFQRFWQDARGPMMAVTGAGIRVPQPAPNRRVAEAFAGEGRPHPATNHGARIPQEDARLSASSGERLRSMDFEAMSTAELDAARAAMARFRLPAAPVTTRRRGAHARGSRVDLRATLRASLRRGGGIIDLRRTRPKERPPALVILCDISGSMSLYSRVLLQFVHTVTNHRDRVHTLLFGTRLTNVTRHLRHRDVDEALRRAGRDAPDWSSGTRIADSLRAFNRAWARRLLSQGAVILLITDGLDRDARADLAHETARLRRSCRRLIWLNPLLRYAGFEARAAGIRAMLPHVDEHRPVHNLASLEGLCRALAQPGTRNPAA